ncbi:hypothetical protein HNP92_001830 [Methanococcus maripaludis]|uniref:Uncharacterized protein n=1 Tax=Methanococcus maripaludis TaxID=39152 RepID=A0A7J9S6S4_METMI|nr:DUF3990 domain-containing protein [Methanococcus maripaludis]MBB6402507.1 hypothetical protein [Methanococcus maripaludis]
MRHGIDVFHNANGENALLDCGHGFYLTPSKSTAEDWADHKGKTELKNRLKALKAKGIIQRKPSKPEPVVLKCHINHDVLDSLEIKPLDDDTALDYCVHKRCGRLHPIDNENYDIIRCAMWDNGIKPLTKTLYTKIKKGTISENDINEEIEIIKHKIRTGTEVKGGTYDYDQYVIKTKNGTRALKHITKL